MYYQKLKDQLFVEINYPKALTDLIDEATAWKDFCALPKEIKDKFTFPDRQKDLDVGYFFRSKAGGREDKEYFHIYPNMRSMIKEDGLAELVESNIALKEFFNYTDKVYEAVHNFALSIGSEMGKEIPELGELVKNGDIMSTFRLLHYTNTDDTEVIAAQHFDRSLYTLHLYENAPGLQFLNYDMDWTDAPIGNGETVVFSGYRLEKLSEGKLQKTWHRVIKKGDHKDRISLILFVSTDKVPNYSTSARSQDLEPSYNPVK